MKKIALISALLLVSLFSFSQTSEKHMYGSVSDYRYRVQDEKTGIFSDWSIWNKAEPGLLIYVDWGFGTAAITNKDLSRFLFSTQGIADTVIDSLTIIKAHSVDNEGLHCDIYFSISTEGILIVGLSYSNTEVEYKIPAIEIGYPASYFEEVKIPKEKL
jgi:hypothetical protein